MNPFLIILAQSSPQLVTKASIVTGGTMVAVVLLVCNTVQAVAGARRLPFFLTPRFLAFPLSVGLSLFVTHYGGKADSMDWFLSFVNGLVVYLAAVGGNTATGVPATVARGPGRGFTSRWRARWF